MRNMHETVLRFFAIGLGVEYARAYAHNNRAAIVPVRGRVSTRILPMICMKAGSKTVKSDGNRACCLRYPCPRAKRRRGKWGNEIDAQDGPKEGPKEGAVRSCFDANHR